jgi:hypothetical protein
VQDKLRQSSELAPLFAAAPAATGGNILGLCRGLAMMGIQAPTERTAHRHRRKIDKLVEEAAVQASEVALRDIVAWIRAGCKPDGSRDSVQHSQLVRSQQTEDFWAASEVERQELPVVLPVAYDGSWDHCRNGRACCGVVVGSCRFTVNGRCYERPPVVAFHIIERKKYVTRYAPDGTVRKVFPVGTGTLPDAKGLASNQMEAAAAHDLFSGDGTPFCDILAELNVMLTVTVDGDVKMERLMQSPRIGALSYGIYHLSKSMCKALKKAQFKAHIASTNAFILETFRQGARQGWSHNKMMKAVFNIPHHRNNQHENCPPWSRCSQSNKHPHKHRRELEIPSERLPAFLGALASVLKGNRTFLPGIATDSSAESFNKTKQAKTGGKHTSHIASFGARVGQAVLTTNLGELSATQTTVNLALGRALGSAMPAVQRKRLIQLDRGLRPPSRTRSRGARKKKSMTVSNQQQYAEGPAPVRKRISIAVSHTHTHSLLMSGGRRRRGGPGGWTGGRRCSYDACRPHGPSRARLRCADGQEIQETQGTQGSIHVSTGDGRWDVGLCLHSQDRGNDQPAHAHEASNGGLATI